MFISFDSSCIFDAKCVKYSTTEGGGDRIQINHIQKSVGWFQWGYHLSVIFVPYGAVVSEARFHFVSSENNH